MNEILPLSRLLTSPVLTVPPVRLVQPREEVEQGAFAASRGADDGKGFPGGQIKGKAVQNRAFAVALAQITDGDARIGRAAH